MSKRPRNKWERRDKKRQRRKFGMRVDGASVKLLDFLQKKKSKKRRPEVNRISTPV